MGDLLRKKARANSHTRKSISCEILVNTQEFSRARDPFELQWCL
jgi:hypothetical protein